MSYQEKSNTVESLRRALEEAERDLREHNRINRSDAVSKLRDYVRDLQRIENEAKELAKEVGLVFYYSSGYEEWSWQDEDGWSASSANC